MTKYVYKQYIIIAGQFIGVNIIISHITLYNVTYNFIHSQIQLEKKNCL